MSGYIKKVKMNRTQLFEITWKKYRRKSGKKEALRHFLKLIRSHEQYQDLLKAIDNYSNHIDEKITDSKFIMYGSKFFLNYEDWIDYEEPILKEEKIDKQIFRQEHMG